MQALGEEKGREDASRLPRTQTSSEVLSSSLEGPVFHSVLLQILPFLF